MLGISRPVSTILQSSGKRFRASIGPLAVVCAIFSLTILLHLGSWPTDIIETFPLKTSYSGHSLHAASPSNESASDTLLDATVSSFPIIAVVSDLLSSTLSASAVPSTSISVETPLHTPTSLPPPSNATQVFEEPGDPSDLDYPPTYTDLRKWQQELPQHNLSLPYPEGQNGRYVKFSCSIKMLGWNNVLNEILMNTLLAYKSNRAFVFSDFVRHPYQYPWPQSKAFTWPPRTPTPALMSGPSFGGPWEQGDPTPRSVSEEWFEVVCPPERRRIINTREVKPALVNATGTEVLEAWQTILFHSPESCIEIQSADFAEDVHPQVFDVMLWTSPRVLSLWEEFSRSPVSRLLRTSPIVERVLQQNEGLFHPDDEEKRAADDPYSRMLAIHLRRTDYKEHCLRLANWNSTYYSWDLLDFLPDKFIPPPGGNADENTSENIALYQKHCWPTQSEIRQRVREARSDYLKALRMSHRKMHDVDVLYILTDDKGVWLDELKGVMANEGWKGIRTSHDLVLDTEGKDVEMGVDMEIAMKAAVFIGNGWSSFTSNIVHRRLVDEKIPMSIRFY